MPVVESLPEGTVKCSGCGSEFSVRLGKCPQCGVPLSQDIMPKVFEPELVNLKTIKSIFDSSFKIPPYLSNPDLMNPESLLLLLIVKLCHYNYTEDNQYKSEAYIKWLFDNSSARSYFASKILTRFAEFGATTPYELKELWGVSRQTFNHVVQGLLTYGLVVQTNRAKTGKTGPGEIIYALKIASPEATIAAYNRFMELKRREIENTRKRDFDPEAERIGRVIDQHLHGRKECDMSEIFPIIKEENKNTLKMDVLSDLVATWLNKNGHIVWRRGKPGKASAGHAGPPLGDGNFTRVK